MVLPVAHESLNDHLPFALRPAMKVPQEGDMVEAPHGWIYGLATEKGEEPVDQTFDSSFLISFLMDITRHSGLGQGHRRIRLGRLSSKEVVQGPRCLVSLRKVP